ncbi:type IV secretion system DNA-binding domain-containing protein [Blastomonas sp.]|uniref:type IV secretion system DNA-binding domain-containing protein n=1 Tax=Blastomonas sp. TaxID=1909299 RepID=UPI0026361CA5|nr:type IV secretion system DNA-binding domain-containing protein [Blastomonas sp.]MDM7955926.1 type IV secretion system DNA-binding domain-containing protein [Blastomonas sp.]
MSRATEQAGRGHAIEKWRLRSTLILLRTGVAFSLLGMVSGVTLVGLASNDTDRQHAISFTKAKASQHLDAAIQIDPRRSVAAPTVLNRDAPERIAAVRLFSRMAIAGGLLGLLLGIGGVTLLRGHWIKAAQHAALDQVLRGNRVATADELTRLVMKNKPSEPLRIGGVPIPPQDEARHFLDIGKSGTGKTSVLQDHLSQIVARGENALIFDPDGSYVERFFQPERGDIILNPWDGRSHRWNMLADIASLDDAHRIAAILLPKPSKVGESNFWFDQARALLAHILDHTAHTESASLDALSSILNTTTAEDLRTIVTNTAAARIFESGGERATASVLFMMTMAARTVATLATIPENAPTFSFDCFYAGLAEHEGPKPMIFLAVPRRYRDAGGPIIAAWIDAAASAILQRNPGDAPKAWLFLDELASLPPVQSLLTLLPEGRKHRACVVIAFQSIAQLRQTYGNDGAEIISGQTATQFIMAPGDAATAKWAVDLFGSAEVETQRASESLGDDPKAHGSLAIHRERKAIVMDSEVTNLATGEGFLRLSGYPIAQVLIAPPKALDIIAPAFVPARLTPRTCSTSSCSAPPVDAVRIEDRDDWLSMGGL